MATRAATCQSPSGAPCPEQDEPTAATCNTAPCESSAWQVTGWGECSAACGGGTRTRSVECLGPSGNATDPGACRGPKPVPTEPCNIQACDFCAGNPCLGRGICTAGACACTDGYAGPKCEIPPSCTSGVVDANLACCPSGLVDLRGGCCPPGSRLDFAGECCGQAIDVCGVCGGDGLFIDMQGSCCTVADANGVCCRSGAVDECGVCDGMNNSCDVLLTTAVEVPASLVMGTGVQGVPIEAFFQGAAAAMGVPPESVTVGDVTLPALRRRRRLAQAPLAAPGPAGALAPGSTGESYPSHSHRFS